MNTRRNFLRAVSATPLIMAASKYFHQEATAPAKTTWLMPEEGDPHERTWMSFGASREIWGKRLVATARKNIANIAQTIAKFEPVTICVRSEEVQIAKKHFDGVENITFFECPLDDIWIRDFGAVYVHNQAGEKAAVDFNFNGWGEKQEYDHDARVAAMMAKHSNAQLIETELCLEGGGIEVDGKGSAIITESCVINANRNEGWSKADCEKALRTTLGIEKVIWLPGVRGADITDGHTDFYARFTSPGVVAAHFDPDSTSPENELTLQQIEILENATDAAGNKLKVVQFEPPTIVRPKFVSDDFCAGYINFYVCNDAVIAMEFGDAKTDGAAKEKLTECFPDREIVMLNIDGIAAGGGGIHCVTQQEPKV